MGRLVGNEFTNILPDIQALIGHGKELKFFLSIMESH